MKILKFGADWCPECVIMRFRLAEIEKMMPELVTEFIDVDKNPELKKERRIEHIPTFVFLADSGEELLRLEGLVEKEDLIKFIMINQ